MSALASMVGKDFKLLARDRMGFFFTFVFPLLMSVFFGTIFSGSGSDTRELSIAVVDEDHTTQSRDFTRKLDDGPEFAVDTLGRAEAIDAVRLGKRTALIVLPQGFGEARQRMFYGKPAAVEIGLDPSRKAEGGMIQGVLTKYLTEDMSQAFSKPATMQERMRKQATEIDTARGLDPGRKATIQRFLGELDRFLGAQAADTALRATASDSGGWQPAAFKTVDIARVRRGPRNAFEISFPQGIIWGILSTALAFALSLVTERTRGTLIRLRAAPIARREILFGKAIGCFVTIVGVSTTLLVIARLVFHVRPTSIPLLAAAIVSAAIGFVGIMMLISVMGSSQRGVSGLGWAVMMIFSMTGGGMVPLFAMPTWMQNMGAVSPVHWAILGIEGAIWRDFTPAQMALPCGILLAIGIVGFALGTRVFRWTEAS